MVRVGAWLPKSHPGVSIHPDLDSVNKQNLISGQSSTADLHQHHQLNTYCNVVPLLPKCDFHQQQNLFLEHPLKPSRLCLRKSSTVAQHKTQKATQWDDVHLIRTDLYIHNSHDYTDGINVSGKTEDSMQGNSCRRKECRAVPVLWTCYGLTGFPDFSWCFSVCLHMSTVAMKFEIYRNTSSYSNWSCVWQKLDIIVGIMAQNY